MTESNKGSHLIFLLLFLFLSLIVIVFSYAATRQTKSTLKSVPGAVQFRDGAEIKVVVGENLVIAEVVATDAKKSIGLGGRKRLTENTGMLFVFDSYGIYPFWNKNMLFPIDIIWIKDDKVVGVHENMLDFASYPDFVVSPGKEVNFVLEVEAGFVKERGIKAGDEVKFSM